MKLSNPSIIQALKRQKTKFTPIWLMRQAGRYLPEYRQSKKSASDFMSMCKSTDFATEITLQPVERFNLDAAILFSDILTIPDAMGLRLSFIKGKGPKLEKPLQAEKDIRQLKTADMEKLRYVFDNVSAIKKALNGRIPLIGFSGSPWTIACYMIEGSGSKDFSQTKKMMFSRPDLMHKILEVNTKSIIHYLKGQIDSGAEALQIFDTWGGILAEDKFINFSLDYINKIINEIKGLVPVTLFSKGTGQYLEHFKTCPADAIGLDWTTPISLGKSILGSQFAIQGNLDPSVLLANPKTIESEARKIMDSFGEVTANTGHIFNLGHGITPETDPENVKFLVDFVHSYSERYHR